MPEINTIWIGNEDKAPIGCIESWGDIHIHDNSTLSYRDWQLTHQMRYYLDMGEINGVADCMRWELIYKKGGTWVDADSSCTRALPEFFNELDAIVAWENEIERPGLIACGFMKFPAQDPFVKQIIEDILANPYRGKMAWDAVGPGAITRSFRKHKPNHLTILPSHFFYPRHLTGRTHESKVSFANQFWSSTFNKY